MSSDATRNAGTACKMFVSLAGDASTAPANPDMTAERFAPRGQVLSKMRL